MFVLIFSANIFLYSVFLLKEKSGVGKRETLAVALRLLFKLQVVLLIILIDLYTNFCISTSTDTKRIIRIKKEPLSL